MVLLLAGCFSAKTPAQRVAACLNKKGFLVQPNGLRVIGTAPDGIAFSVVALTGTIDDAGNPEKRKLTSHDHTLVRACLH